jgi:heme-degrading monooxygenase HmoA
VDEQHQERFLAAYDRVCQDVASAPGHIMDQVCQSVTDPCEWIITSEWASPDHFLAWDSGPGQRELSAPLVAASSRHASLRYVVHRQTGTSEAA